MGNTVYNIHAKASLPCVHLPVIAIAGKGAIRKSCVLWYDPARQGCTNERMAANPVLKDLSGNGHDATCYNFAWTEESGIGTTNYPNALVSDGVDDYAKTQPFHIPKEFTVMWDVDWLGEKTDPNSGFVKPNSFFVYKGGKDDNITVFINNVSIYDSIPKDTFCISGLTAYDKEYNAVALTDAQNVNESTSYLGIFVGTINSKVVSMAFRKFLLFDSVLTLYEIDWVKTNILGEANQ